MRTILLFIFMIPALLCRAAPAEKPDTGFQSIHQVQAQQNQPDSSARPGNPAPVDTAAAPVNRVLGTVTLLVVLFIVLVITVCLVIIFSFRRKRRNR